MKISLQRMHISSLRLFSIISVLLLVASCTTAPRYTRAHSRGSSKPSARFPEKKTEKRIKSSVSGGGFVGTASYYGPGFQGRSTASGERFNMYDLTAAHRTLPFGTRVQVTNLSNGKSVTVRINDRGPFKRGRIIDLSKAAAGKIDMISSGTARVRVKVLQ